MIYPMRRFGYNVTERFLSSMGNVFGLMFILATPALVWTSAHLAVRTMWGGVLVTGVLVSGLLLGLGSGGIRQNRSVFNFGLRITLVTGIAWGIHTAVSQTYYAAIVSAGMIAVYVICAVARQEAIRSRFAPRFFSLRQFETMIAIADVMIDDEEEKLHPVEIALRTDHLLAKIHSSAKKDILRVLFLIEWILPVLMLRPIPFSELGTHERRRLVKKIIWSRGIFRDISRTLKLLTMFSYYTEPSVRSSIGYVEFDDRERVKDLDQTPKSFHSS
jgi:hypothetical protein